MSKRVEYSSQVAPADVPSGAIWGEMPMEDIILHGRGRHYFNDFDVAAPTFASATAQLGMITYQSAGVTIKPIATNSNGVLEIAGADADNDEGSIQFGVTSAVYAKISSTGGKKLAFEMRISPTTATLADTAFFCGLAEEASAVVDILVNNTGALKTTADFIGFRTLCASATELDTVYQKASQALVEPDDNVQTLVSGTWYKLGLLFDPSNTAKAIRYFVDGVEVASVAASALDDATFPDGEEMALLVAIKAGEAVEKKFQIDWVKFAQVK